MKRKPIDENLEGTPETENNQDETNNVDEVIDNDNFKNGYFIQDETTNQIIASGFKSQKDCIEHIKNENVPNGDYKFGCMFPKHFKKEIVTKTVIR